MRTDLAHLEPFRKLAEPYSSRPGDPFGAFFIRRGSVTLICIASPGDASMPWQHVSARARLINGNERVPTWAEMCFLKDQFWDDADCGVTRISG
jgi:hypothetical protein